MKYSNGKKTSKHKLRIILIATALVLVVAIAGVVGSTRYWYSVNLRPLSQQSQKILIEVPIGYSTEQIANLLQQKNVIKSATAFEWYIRANNLRDRLQAGEYMLDSSNSVSQIAGMITQGSVAKQLFTILPGQRIDQIKKSFLKAGFESNDVEQAFNPENYKNYPALVAKPTNASLEGYLYPESFQTTSATTTAEIIRQSLDQMAKRLTPDMIDDFQKQGLGIHQAITLASIIEKEVSNGEDRRIVASVFLNRLDKGMALGSDVTYHYAAAITGQEPTPFIDSPYNTRMYSGLPPGPISNVSKSSLDAVANPAQSDYLFFVAGDDGITYFSKTAAEHERLAKEHCKVLCSTY